MMDKQILSEEEFKQMFSLLKRFTETEMDQFCQYKFNSKYGDVFVDLIRETTYPDKQYTDVSHLTENT